jgi:hypothetical protein
MPVILSEAGMRAGTQTTIRHKFETDNGNKGEVWELIQTLVSGRVPASRILELFYWSQEPGALEMLRSFLGLSAQDSAALLRPSRLRSRSPPTAPASSCSRPRPGRRVRPSRMLAARSRGRRSSTIAPPTRARSEESRQIDWPARGA